MEEEPTSEPQPQDTKRRRTGEHALHSHQRLVPGEPSDERRRRVSASSADNMQRSTSPSGSSNIKLTKTGRVSKATKGQRVHHCEDCGKTYTRNEHLRRHQQNHKPGAFPCDIPGCGRSFYREDLLTRHKARHGDPENPPSRRESLVSEGSPGLSARTLPGVPRAGALLPVDSSAGFSDSRSPTSTSLSPAPAQQQDAQRPNERRARKGYIPLNELHGVPSAISVDTQQQAPVPYFGHVNWEPSPPCSPEDEFDHLAGPTEYLGQQSQPCLQEDWSTTSFHHPYDVNMLRSPVSANSIPQAPYWDTPMAGYMQDSTTSSENSFGRQSHLGGSDGNNSQPWLGGPNLEFVSAEQRDFMEQDDLATPLFGPQAHDFGPNLQNNGFDNEQRYLDAYWDSVHSLWPIVHKPTYDIFTASPLLRASMFALGAQSTGHPTDFSNGRTLHDRCIKVLQKRTIRHSHTYRSCDLQAVLLVEVYSIFRSKRPPLHLSSSFDSAYEALVNDPVANPALTAFAMDPMLGCNTGISALESGLEQESRKRLLAAYYLLDRHHATLFGRPISTRVSFSSDILPFPRHQDLWDTMITQQFTPYGYDPDLPPYEFMLQALMAAKASNDTSPESHDVFASMVLLAGLTEEIQRSGTAIDSEEQTGSFNLVAETSPRARLAYHSTMLCKHTPVRDLLAVAGESWVMVEKMRSQADYSAAQLSIRTWASGFQDESSDSHLALKHAFEILKIHQGCNRPGLLFDEWTLHLASIVIWAKAYSSLEPRRRPRISVPTPTEPKSSSHEMEQAVSRTILAGADASLVWKDAKKVLSWSKAKLDRTNAAHACGLTNGALDVLGKLISRGDEEDCWF